MGQKTFKLYLLKVICESLRSNPPLLYTSQQQCFIHVRLDFDGEPTFEENKKRSLIGKSCYIIKQIGIMDVATCKLAVSRATCITSTLEIK